MAGSNVWKKRKWLRWAGFAVVLVILGYTGYSVYYYLSTAEKVEEYDVCVDGKCVKTYHIHADIQIVLCGENVILPLEHGPLEGPHTHKKRNYVHFHERLPYDPETGAILDTTPLELGTFMNEFDLRFNEQCIGKYCNGDKCPEGNIGTVRMFVNEIPNTEFDRYVWKDDDEILITFD